MSTLLAFNKTTSPLTLAAGNPVPPVCPASSVAGQRSLAPNDVTAELVGLSVAQYQALDAQRAANLVDFVWTDDPRYLTTGLLVKGPDFSPIDTFQGTNKRLPNGTFVRRYIIVKLGGNDSTGNGTLAAPYATVARARQDIPQVIDGERWFIVCTGIGQQLINQAVLLHPAAVCPHNILGDSAQELYRIPSIALASNISAVDTTVPATLPAGISDLSLVFPPEGWARVDNEVFSYTGITATSFLGRSAILGTTAASHTAGATITAALPAWNTSEDSVNLLALPNLVDTLQLADLVTVTDNPLTAGATTANVSSTTGLPTPATALTTIDAPLSATAETINIGTIVGTFPPSGIVQIDSERIYYRQKTGTTLDKCIRGFDGTTAATHVLGSVVTQNVPILIDNEIVLYSGLTATSLTGLLRGRNGTSAASHVLNSIVLLIQDYFVRLVIIPSPTKAWTPSAFREMFVMGNAAGQYAPIAGNTSNNLEICNSTTLTAPITIVSLSAEIRRTNVAPTNEIAVMTDGFGGAINMIGIKFSNANPQVSLQANNIGGLKAAMCDIRDFTASLPGVISFTGCRFGVGLFLFQPRIVVLNQMFFDAIPLARWVIRSIQSHLAINSYIADGCGPIGTKDTASFGAGLATALLGTTCGLIRNGLSHGILHQGVGRFQVGTTGGFGIKIDSCAGDAVRMETPGSVVLRDVVGTGSTGYGVQATLGDVQASSNNIFPTGALGDMKVGSRAARSWVDFRSATPANSNVTKNEHDVPAQFRQPLKFTFSGLAAAASFDITTLVGSPPAIQCINGLRVTTVGTAALGARIISDAGDTPTATIATLSDDGKTVTFEGTVTGFTISYVPAVGQTSGARVWQA